MKSSVIVVVALSAALVVAPAAQEPRFEVASVKVSPRTSMEQGGESRSYRAGQVQFVASPLRRIVEMAFNVHSAQLATRFDVSRIPARLYNQTWFDIHGKGAGNMNAMVRTLLEERFGMRWHRETRQVPAYRLTVKQPGTLGPWLRPSSVNCRAVAGDDPGSVAREAVPKECYGAGELRNGRPRHRTAGTMSDLAVTLQAFSTLPIVDATGLKGNYAWDFAMHWTLPGQPDGPLRDSVEDQLGLKLERAMVPWEVIVIDALHLPTPN